MKRIFITFSVVFAFVMILAAFSTASAAVLVAPTSLSSWQVIVSPPIAVLNSINYLENENSNFDLYDGISVSSDNGTIRIVNTSANWTVTVFDAPSKAAAFQYKVEYNSTFDGKENITVLMLESNNGYPNYVTNPQGRVTYAFNLKSSNKTTSAIILAEYPILASVKIENQVSPDTIIGPPPGGGPYTWEQGGHWSWTGSGNEIAQLWMNVTVWFWQNSSNGPATFVRLEAINTAEAPQIVFNFTWLQTYLYLEVSQNNGNPVDSDYEDAANLYTVPNYVVQVPSPALSWFFTSYNWSESNWSLLGHTLWGNGTIAYGAAPNGELWPNVTLSVPTSFQV